MEPILFIGGVIVIAGGIWSFADLLQDTGLMSDSAKKKVTMRAAQACSGFKSRDISSSTACRAGFSQ